MDRAGRNFLALAAVALLIGAFGLCALIAYGILPLVEGRAAGTGLAAMAVAGLVALIGRCAWLAAQVVRREAVAGRALSRRISAAAMPIPATLCRVAEQTGLAGRVVLIDSESACSFVYGLRSPKVVISAGLLERLSTEELSAALEHERYHVANLDPLRSVVARVVADALFLLPALEGLRSRYEAARELAADRRAMALVGRRPLVGALLKVMEDTDSEAPATVALAAPNAIESRLIQLETGREPTLGALAAGRLGATLLGALGFLALLVVLPLAVGGTAELARELGPESLLEGAVLCLAPLAVVATFPYLRLSIRSRRGLRPPS